VIIDNLDLVSTIFPPDKAQAPLVVDADAVLTQAITLEYFELISRRNAQGSQDCGRMQLQQLSPRHPLNVPKPGYGFAVKQSCRIRAGERMDHGVLCSVVRNL
jgi:hypothetical protein